MKNYLKQIPGILCAVGMLAIMSSCSSVFKEPEKLSVKINGEEYADKLRFGERKPQITNEFMKFASTASDADSAYIEDVKADLSKGLFMKVKFKADKDQSNPYPRLVAQRGAFSIHISNTMPKKVKFMILGENGKYVQLIEDLPKNDSWHEAIAVYDPVKKTAMFQIDNMPIQSEKVNISLKPFEPKNLFIGSNKKDASNRGFNGLISSVSLRSPYKYEKGAFNPENKIEVSENDTKGVAHVTLCHIPGRHMAFPGVAQMPNGDLAAVFREGAGHICPYGRICIVYSKDKGKNWSAPVTIADTESDERDPAIQTLSDGRVLVSHGGWNSWMATNHFRKKFKSETEYIKQAGEDDFGGSKYIFSNDNGKNWSKPIKAKAFCPHGPLFYNGKFYNPSLETDSKAGKRRVVFYEADKAGNKWKKIGTVGESAYVKNAYKDTPVYEEPHTIALKDGTFMTAIRVPSDGYMRVSFSKDQGKTWSKPVKTKLKGYPQHLLQLKDGRILATYGYRYQPFGIRASISKDGGKTWDLDNEIVIRSGGINCDLGYPVSIEMEDGKILSVYYYNDKARNDCFIEGAFYKP